MKSGRQLSSHHVTAPETHFFFICARPLTLVVAASQHDYLVHYQGLLKLVLEILVPEVNLHFPTLSVTHTKLLNSVEMQELESLWRTRPQSYLAAPSQPLLQVNICVHTLIHHVPAVQHHTQGRRFHHVLQKSTMRRMLGGWRCSQHNE